MMRSRLSAGTGFFRSQKLSITMELPADYRLRFMRFFNPKPTFYFFAKLHNVANLIAVKRVEVRIQRKIQVNKRAMTTAGKSF